MNGTDGGPGGRSLGEPPGRDGGQGKRLRPAACWVLLCFVAVLCACQDDAGTNPDCGWGAIEGSVLSAEAGVEVEVTAELLTEGTGIPVVASTRCHPDGTYQLAVPYGRYRLSLTVPGIAHPLSWPLAAPSEDTLTVSAANPAPRADVHLGALTIQLTVPPDLEGDRLRGVFTNAPGAIPSYQATVEAAVLSGRAEFRFPALPPGPGVARVHVRSGGTLPLPLVEPATEIQIEVGLETRREYALPPPALVRGRVLGSWLQFQELSGLRPIIALVRPDTTVAAISIVTPPGDFSLQLWEDGRVSLRVTIGDLRRWLGGQDLESASVFTLRPGQEVVIPDFRESGMACRLSGPVPANDLEARVEVVDSTGTVLAAMRSAGVGPTNLFVVSNLGRGRYYLQARPEAPCRQSWIPCWYDRALSRARATPIEVVRDGIVVSVSMDLVQGGTIAGLYVAGDGPPPSEVERDEFVRLVLPGDSTQVVCAQELRVQNPSQFAFAFPGLPDGFYRLRVDMYFRGVRFAWWYPGTWIGREALIVSIENQQSRQLEPWRHPTTHPVGGYPPFAWRAGR